MPDATPSPLPPVGIIAGAGRLPVLEAQGVRAAGRRVVGLPMRGLADAEFLDVCDAVAPVPALNLSRWLRAARRHGVREAVMVGKVPKTLMYDPVGIARNLPDLRMMWLFWVTMRGDRRTQSGLTVLADRLRDWGLTLIDTTTYIPDHLADEGVMTRNSPPASALADIDFGWPVLLRSLELDIGQALAVKGRDVVAVEAMEGTDAMIARAGALAKRGWVLLKAGGNDKDPRFDVPTIGVQTVEKVAQAGGVAIAVQRGAVILLDKPAVLAAADRRGVAIVGRAG